MNKNKNLAFTLAEVLIVIGIIGVVAALTLPNLNHATSDKETVTRLQKAYSILNEANDRAVAIYGQPSTWSEECRNDFNNCWMKRIGEFLKIAKSCDESGDEEEGTYSSCDSLAKGDIFTEGIMYQLSDGISFSSDLNSFNCEGGIPDVIHDICIVDLFVDVNGPNKGINKAGIDQFGFSVSDSLGILYVSDFNNCLSRKSWGCSFWPLEYGNLDYLKADSSGKCNDSNIILDGTTNTSCH